MEAVAPPVVTPPPSEAEPAPEPPPGPAPEAPVPAAPAPASPVAAAPPPVGPDVVLDVRGLRTQFFTYDGVVKALDGVTFDLRRGETVGLVGETGCGKSVTAFSVMRLVPDPPGRIVEGHVRFHDADLLWGLDREAKFSPIRDTGRVRVRRRYSRIKASDARVSMVRGRGIAMIFQEPTQAMNPVFSIASSVGEVLYLHRGREVLDDMLAATPDAPGVGPALEAVVAAAERRRNDELRTAAKALGDAAGSPRLTVQALHAARTMATSRAVRRELGHAVRDLRLSRLQRAYLEHRRRLLALREQLREVQIAEMREGRPRTGEVRRLRLRSAWERGRHAYFRLWGIHRSVERPLKNELFWRVVRLLEGVSIANAVQVARGYPHELSGGMLQRVMIAMAMSADPEVLIADEPTTALDVTIQAQILDLMQAMKRRAGTAILLITHDLAVVAEVADRLCVMYAGQIVERGTVRDVFRRPLHPYTQGLLASIPRLDRPDRELQSIAGSVPDLIDPPSGCRFHPRCPHAMPVCRGARPPTTQEGPDHAVACYLYDGPRVEG
jgi:peptide/nickel transport system ATP-binding protein